MNAKAGRLRRSGRITPEDLAHAYIDSEAVCHYCMIGITPEDCSFDHVIPFVAGGENTPGNIVACCLTCQRQKASRMAHEFALAREHTAVCEVCGTRFKPRWADVRRGYGTTCSAPCAGRKGRQVRSARAA
jgi:hypothetical protein